jgi:hypothetical protein
MALLPAGLVYDPAGHVILDPDTAIQGAVRHLFTTFEATGPATAVVKAFRAAGLSFPLGLPGCNALSREVNIAELS